MEILLGKEGTMKTSLRTYISFLLNPEQETRFCPEGILILLPLKIKAVDVCVQKDH